MKLGVMTPMDLLIIHIRQMPAWIGTVVLLISGSTVLAQQPETSPPYDESHWQTEEMRRAYSALDGQSAQVLVVPFQIENHSFDAESRSLMTLSLGYRLVTGSDLSVANPVLVAKAFGVQGRQYTSESVRRIAGQVGARSVVIGRVGHDTAGKMSIRISMLSLDENAAHTEETELYSATGLGFNDHRLPYELFLERRDEIARLIAGNLTELKQLNVSEGEFEFPPLPPQSLQPGPLMAQVAYLQMLAVMHPIRTEDRLRELLFERSLVLLENVDKASANYALFKARALLYLNRRPAAIDVLAAEQSAAANALRAYANGNLSALEETQAEIEEPLLSALAEIEAERLAADYENAPNREAARSYYETNTVWGPLLYVAMSDYDHFRSFTTVHLKASLDAAFPDSARSLESFFAARAATGVDVTETDLARLLIDHIDDLDVKLSECAALAICSRDYLDLLRSMLAGEIIDRVWHIKSSLGKPEQALRFAADYETLLEGHPAFTLTKSYVLRDLLEMARASDRPGLARAQGRAMRNSLWWPQRRTRMTTGALDLYAYGDPEVSALALEDRIKITFETDWPRPPIIAHAYAERSEFARLTRQCADYAIRNFECFRAYHEELMVMQTPFEDAAAYLDKNRYRFVGHPDRLRYLGVKLEQAGKHDAAIELYRDAVDSQTREIAPYEVLFNAAVMSADFDEAADIGFSFPGFIDGEASSRIGLSNYAYEFGSILYWAGAYEQAAPYYELTASYGTASAAEMSSEQRLALIAGDYEESIYHAMRRIRRYDSTYAHRDIIGLYAMIGELDTASVIVASSDARLRDPPAWIGALVEQRARGRSADAIAEWALESDRRGDGKDADFLAMRHVFIANTLDRRALESLPATLESLDPRTKPYYLGYGRAVDYGSTMMVKYFVQQIEGLEAGGKLKPETYIDRRMVIGAKAMLAFDKGDFANAFESLDFAVNFYDLNEFLPYYAWASAKTDNRRRVQKALARMLGQGPTEIKEAIDINFYASLANAVLLALDGKHAEAMQNFQKANGVILHNQTWLLLTRYQIIELARLLHAETGDSSYHDFALDLARRNTVIEPMQAYTHSFVAMMSEDRDERIVALARVLILDQHSRSIELADKAELSEARELAKNGYPTPMHEKSVGA